MAPLPITISGVLCDKYGRTIRPVTLVGEATITGLGVGGGPIVPPDSGGGAPPDTGIWPGPGDPDFPGGGKPPGGGDPPHIWGGGNVPMPSPPIANVPGAPGYHPPQPDQPPPGGDSKPPPEQGGWGYWAGDGVDSWVYKPAPNEAQPKG